jgi:hypothetical protein
VIGVKAVRSGEGRGGLKHKVVGSIVLEDMDEEFVFELGLSSGTLGFLLPGVQVVEGSGHGG